MTLYYVKCPNCKQTHASVFGQSICLSCRGVIDFQKKKDAALLAGVAEAMDSLEHAVAALKEKGHEYSDEVVNSARKIFDSKRKAREN